MRKADPKLPVRSTTTPVIGVKECSIAMNPFAQATIASVEVLGAFRAPAAVKAALASRTV